MAYKLEPLERSFGAVITEINLLLLKPYQSIWLSNKYSAFIGSDFSIQAYQKIISQPLIFKIQILIRFTVTG